MTKKLKTIAAVMMAAYGVVSAQAQNNENDINTWDKELEHVLVSVPVQRTEAETALPITVITGDELANRVANTIGETLNSKPGLASASFGPAVGQPVIRGQQGARVTVMQNSMRSADASTVSADHSVNLEPVLAESIEVLRGPSALLYGGGAIGGVVNMIDRRVPIAVPDQLTGAGEVRHGSVNDETTAVITFDTGRDQFALHIDAMKRESNAMRVPGLAAHEHKEEEQEETTDGYIGNTDSEAGSFTLGSSYLLDNGYIGLAVNRMENEYGIPAGAHSGHGHGDEEEHDADHASEEHEEDEQSVRLDIKQTRYDMRMELNNPVDSIEKLRWFFAYTDYAHDELEGDTVGTRWTRDGWESRLELSHHEWQGWNGVVGLQLQSSELEAVGDESYLPKTDSTHYGVFLVEGFSFNDWLYEFGVRVDQSEVDPKALAVDKSFTSVSLSASALWKISSSWRLGVALSQSERAPVAEELYSNAGNEPGDYVEHVATGAIEVGDENLDSEQSNNLDLTLNYRNQIIDGYVTFFYNDFEDYIYLNNRDLPQEEVPVYDYRQENATFKGVEFEFALLLGRVAGGEVSLDIFGDWLEGELDTAGDVSRLPPSRLGSRLNYETDAFSAYVSVVEADDQDKPGDNEEGTKGYTRWDAGMNYRVGLSSRGELLTFLRVKNISDEEIRNSASFLRDIAPEAGRSIEAGIRYSF